jgi:hypothetical protein
MAKGLEQMEKISTFDINVQILDVEVFKIHRTFHWHFSAR